MWRSWWSASTRRWCARRWSAVSPGDHLPDARRAHPPAGV